MIKRTLYFGNPVYLSVQHNQLIVRYPEIEKNDHFPDSFKKVNTASIPVEDIGFVILDHRQITITHALIEALVSNNAVIVTCDNTHHPSGLLLPIDGHSIQSERIRAQVSATEPLKKQLWAQTVSQKIKNQYQLLNKSNIACQYLKPLLATYFPFFA
jgi:CRISPR-associated protein Cas1